MELAALKKIELRKAWKHEALDFSVWLAKPENLALLSEEIEIDIALIERESDVGDFQADILAEEEGTGRKIIIENQLERTNHDHLGKLVTYASGHDAEIVIWIVEEVREEHRKAVDWLNEHTDEAIAFFVLRMELWQIGDSPYAPKFHVVCQPNDWAKTMKQSARQSTLTDTKMLQLEFWNTLKEYGESRPTSLRLRKPGACHWYSISMGSSEAHLSLTINTPKNLLGCELHIVDSKPLFQALLSQRAEIEKEIGSPLEWMELPSRKASRIKLCTAGDITQSDQWQNSFEWMIKTAELFDAAFRDRIRQAIV